MVFGLRSLGGVWIAAVLLLSGCAASEPKAPEDFQGEADVATGTVDQLVRAFDVDADAVLNATLTWSIPSSQLHLDLAGPGATHGLGGGMAWTLSGKLAPGHYVLSVKGSAILPDHWKVSAAFLLAS